VYFQITGRISESIFTQIESSPEKKIEIDVSKIKFLTSKELSRLLIISKKNGKNIYLLHPNDHIKETIAVLGFQSILTLQD
jgi:ribonucleotide monophosphatase NagD (HAD superfamily)